MRNFGPLHFDALVLSSMRTPRLTVTVAVTLLCSIMARGASPDRDSTPDGQPPPRTRTAKKVIGHFLAIRFIAKVHAHVSTHECIVMHVLLAIKPLARV